MLVELLWTGDYQPLEQSLLRCPDRAFEPVEDDEAEQGDDRDMALDGNEQPGVERPEDDLLAGADFGEQADEDICHGNAAGE